MTGKPEQARTLAALLELHHDEIVTAWSGKVHDQTETHYGQAPLDEIKASASRGLSALEDSLKTGSPQVLESYLSEVSLTRLEAGFNISEVLEAILLLRGAVSPVILRAYSSELTQALSVINLLDDKLRYMAMRLSSFFAEGMEKRLLDHQQQTAHLLETSESMQRVTSALLQKVVTLKEVLELVCSEALTLIGASGSAVLLVEGERWLRIAASSGRPSPSLSRLAIGESFAGLVIAQGKPLLLNNPESQIQAYYRNPDLQTMLAVPLVSDEGIIGALDVINKPGGFGEQDVRILRLFANQAAIAIENAQLHERAEELAVIEERQRLARELHDSVTQALYSVNLYAEATRMALSAGKTEVAAENVQELRNMAREAILDMRMLIFELHQPAWEREGLASALQARLEAVEARSGLQTAFHVQGDARLPISVEEELYRIAQEALTNAVKHARAQEVIVRLNAEHDRFYLEVHDDGTGFDLSEANESGGMGLHSIKERVERVNGELTIDSVVGEGTTLRVEVKA